MIHVDIRRPMDW